MPSIEFTPEDILQTQEVPAGWYPVEMTQVSESPGKKDPTSTTYTCIFKVVDGPMKGLEIQHWFSTKMQQNAIRFIKCFVPNLQPGKSYELAETINKPVSAYLVYDMERYVNTIKDFKPIR